MSIQAAPALETVTVASSSTLPDDANAPTPPEKGEVTDKRRKKERNAVAKKIKRKVGRSGGKSSSQE
ncbi:hypothetical protein COCNU_07G008050 [Cocos nucifera]|uniref:Uncharacterized protein n=1 Tax=Cocos nucifera TaxID=13894 RepID=A0A8K0N4U5_COCNU|nr:hypothetical protein COCNU_07G008050 [Cocos nucifera]